MLSFEGTAAAYRDSLEMLLARRDSLFALRRQQAEGVSHAPAIYARRIGRSAAGMVLALAFVGMGVFSVPPARDWAPKGNVACLLWSWPLAAAVYVIASSIARRRARRLTIDVALTDDVRADVRRLEAMSPDHDARRAVDGLEKWSVALPLIGLSLVVPLSLHYLVTRMIEPSGFEVWIAISLAIVGHAHVVLAVCGYMFARKLRRLSTTLIIEGESAPGWGALGVTIGAAAIPGAVFFLVPPILSALTGVLFVPAMFGWMRKRVIEERRLVDIEEPIAESGATLPA